MEKVKMILSPKYKEKIKSTIVCLSSGIILGVFLTYDIPIFYFGLINASILVIGHYNEIYDSIVDLMENNIRKLCLLTVGWLLVFYYLWAISM